MKRSLVIIGLILIAAVAFAVEYQSRLGSHDLRWGTGSWVDNGGRTRYFISGIDIPFSYDNNIKIGNTNLYNLSSAVIGNWNLLYTNGSGTITVIALDNAGLCFKSNGPANIPVWGDCGSGGGGSYNPAAVAITGGTIDGIYLGLNTRIPGVSVDGNISLYNSSSANFFGASGGAWSSSFYYDGSTIDTMLHRTTSSGSAVSDNVPMYQIQVRYTGSGTVSPTKVVLRVKDYGTPLLDVMGNGAIIAYGTVHATAGVTTSVADGYRRLNICNTGGVGAFLFTPQAGDLACSDNVYYVYAGGSWATLGSTGTGGGDNTVTKMSVTDDFNRANANPVGTPWVQLDNNVANIRIISNEAACGAGGGIAYYGDNTFASNQYAQVKITSVVTAAENGGPVVRAQNSGGGNAYVLFVTDATTAKVYKTIAGVWTQLGANCSGTFAQNDILRLEVSGSTLTPKLNGTAISGCERTDTVLTVGRPGAYMDGADWRLDDWAGGDL